MYFSRKIPNCDGNISILFILFVIIIIFFGGGLIVWIKNLRNKIAIPKMIF